ncbi:MAG: hypothetical protein ACFFBP_05480 [Promethearchaeota archaeon]
MQDNKRTYLFFFSVLYTFCAILFFISGFLKQYIFKSLSIPLNFLFFGGGISCIFTSVLLLLSANNLKNWNVEKYLRYLRPIIIIGIATTTFLIIVLCAAGLMEYLINMFTPYEERIYDLESHIFSYGGNLLGNISVLILVLVNVFIFINYIAVYQNDHTTHQERKQEKKIMYMWFFSLIYFICAIVFFIAGFLPQPDLSGEESEIILNYPMIVGGALYITISFLLFYTTIKRKIWLKEKYLSYLKVILIIGIATTAFFAVTIIFLLSMQYVSVMNGGLETYEYPWLYMGYNLGMYSLIILALLTFFIFFYYVILYKKDEVEYYQKYGESIYTSKELAQV